jgi:hypothetical protein
MNSIKKSIYGISAPLFLYHTYCGYEINSYDRYTKNQPLIVDSNGIYSVFPWFLFSIYKDICRIEIYLSEKNPNDYKYLFDEVLFKK